MQRQHTVIKAFETLPLIPWTHNAQFCSCSKVVKICCILIAFVRHKTTVSREHSSSQDNSRRYLKLCGALLSFISYFFFSVLFSFLAWLARPFPSLKCKWKSYSIRSTWIIISVLMSNSLTTHLGKKPTLKYEPIFVSEMPFFTIFNWRQKNNISFGLFVFFFPIGVSFFCRNSGQTLKWN